MARISLLFSLALVLAISSVLAHPPINKKIQKTLCPPTLSKLQGYPFIEISKIVKKEARSAQTLQFNLLFSICKGYTDYLGNFQKYIGSKDVVGMVHAKFGMMTKAMLQVKSAIGVEGSLALKLKNSYSDMAYGFVELTAKISEISAKYHFNGDAKISQSDRMEIDNCLIKLKGSMRIFVTVVTEISQKYSSEKKFDFTLKPGVGGFIGAYVKKGLGHAGKVIGLGGHGQVNAGVKVGAHAGGKVGAHAGGRIGAHAGGKIGGHAGGNIGGLFRGFLGLGGNVQFNSAGKANIGGGSEFKPLSHPHKKHLN